MAFFDDWGKKISNASQSAVQKTKDMAEVAKLNGQISDEEKKINNYYFQIGKLYMQLHRDDFGAEFAEMVTAVKQSEGKILSYQKQIQDVKGIVRCEKCGSEVPNTAAFCNACGAPIAKQTPSAPVVTNQAPPAPAVNTQAPPAAVVTTQAPQNIKPVVKCSGCGAEVPDNMRFCTSCGTPVGTTAPAQPVGRTCPNCGAAAGEGLAFCTQCGSKLG